MLLKPETPPDPVNPPGDPSGPPESGRGSPAALLIIPKLPGVICHHITRRNSIHINAQRCPFVRQQAGEAQHAAFGRRIGGHPDAAPKESMEAMLMILPP